MSAGNQQARLEAFLANAEAKLRRILEVIETDLKNEDLLEIVPKNRNLTISKVMLDESTYLVTRVPLGQEKDLSPRQREVLDLLLEGLPRKTIAFRLGISPRTVESHVERLFVKYGVNSQISLVRRVTLMS